MFEFKNKTIDEFRNEVLGFLGKEITLANGQKRILETVTECGEQYLSTMTGNFQFMSNGEFDWDKGTKGVKMYGFVVETKSEPDGYGRICTMPERISVPFEDRNNKMIIKNNYDNSIFK